MRAAGLGPVPDAADGASHAGRLEDGMRVGRFVVIRDVDGLVHAVAAGSVGAACETGDGDTLLMLPGARMVRVPRGLGTVLAWLDGRGPGTG